MFRFALQRHAEIVFKQKLNDQRVSPSVVGGGFFGIQLNKLNQRTTEHHWQGF